MAEVEDGDVDAGWPEGEVDGEEEPLFADDISDYEEDPPPLPPPMPSLGELRQRGHSNASNGAMSGGGSGVFPDTQPDLGGAGAAPGGGANDQEPPQKKRKPILTLKVERIFSEKGLNYVEKEFPKLKFKGKGHEASDLKFLLQQYEHWANMLYPKLTFKDLTDRVEALASKKDFKSQLLMMRRRAARGGRATPPLRSDDSDEEGRTGGRDAGHSTLHSENGTSRDNPDGNGSGGEGSSDTVHQNIHNSETLIVGGASGNGNNGKGGVSNHSNSALNRLTMDAYGSSEED